MLFLSFPIYGNDFELVATINAWLSHNQFSDVFVYLNVVHFLLSAHFETRKDTFNFYLLYALLPLVLAADELHPPSSLAWSGILHHLWKTFLSIQ